MPLIKQQLSALLKNKILLLDGAMGTMIQRYQLNETHYRGDTFADWPTDLKGNNDLLSITKPEVIQEIHFQYLEAGADIIETNTFNAQSVSLEDFSMSHLASQINHAAVQCAQAAVAQYRQVYGDDNRPIFVAGAIGPMNKTLSLSPDVNRPGYRAVTFDQVADAYYEQVKALDEAGVHLLLVETIFDTLNAKAAIYAINTYYQNHPEREKLPIMISGTITDASGRTLSGQTLEAFLISVEHAEPISIGLNCALGAEDMRPYIEELSRQTTAYVSCYPNAGLPNAMGEYDETPEITAQITSSFAKAGWINILGGCCGTTPAHIKAMKEAIKHLPARKIPQYNPVV